MATRHQGWHVPDIQVPLANGVASTIATITVPNNGCAGGWIFYSCRCDNGVDYQRHTGMAIFAVVNKAGAFTSQIIDEPAAINCNAFSAGNLTDVWTITTAPGVANIRVAFTSTLVNPVFTFFGTLYNADNQVPTFF